MPIKPSSNLGDLSPEQGILTEFRDSLQILLDDLFDKAHEEPTSNAVIVVKNTVQVGIPTDTETKILFDQVIEGDTGEFDVLVGRYIPSEIGDYMIHSSIELPSITVTSRIYLIIKKNSTEVWKGPESLISASVSGLVVVEEGDFIEIYLSHSDGSAQDTSAVPSRVKFAGYKIP